MGNRQPGQFKFRFEQLTARELLAGDLGETPGVDDTVPAEVCTAVPAETTGAETDDKPTEPKPTDGEPIDGSDGDGPNIGPPTDGHDGTDDVVAIFDDDDGVRPAGTADSEDFEEAADDFANHLGAPTWEEILQELEDYVNEHGLIDELHIFDHGYTDTHQQQFGDNPLTPEQLGQLDPYLASGADLFLQGCTVGADPDYCNEVADETDATVHATVDNVNYHPNTWWNYGGWDHHPVTPYVEFDGTDDEEE